MKVYRDSEYKGVRIELDANEFACAIHVYLRAHNITVTGSSTVRVSTHEGDTGLCGGASVYADPSGCVFVDGDLVR